MTVDKSSWIWNKFYLQTSCNARCFDFFLPCPLFPPSPRFRFLVEFAFIRSPIPSLVEILEKITVIEWIEECHAYSCEEETNQKWSPLNTHLFKVKILSFLYDEIQALMNYRCYEKYVPFELVCRKIEQYRNELKIFVRFFREKKLFH